MQSVARSVSGQTCVVSVCPLAAAAKFREPSADGQVKEETGETRPLGPRPADRFSAGQVR